MSHTIDNSYPLEKGLKQLNLTLSQAQIQQLMRYLEQLHQWNQAYHLTGIKSLSRMVTHHILDSLSVLPYLYGKNILDVGSGPGLPGIPLAIASPEQNFTLLDCHEKKTIFLRQVISHLQLKHVAVVKKRLNLYQPAQHFDSIICRAFSRFDDFVSQTKHLCRKGGKLIGMKGDTHIIQQETQHLKVDIYPLRIPGIHAQRHVIIFTVP